MRRRGVTLLLTVACASVRADDSCSAALDNANKEIEALKAQLAESKTHVHVSSLTSRHQFELRQLNSAPDLTVDCFLLSPVSGNIHKVPGPGKFGRSLCERWGVWHRPGCVLSVRRPCGTHSSAGLLRCQLCHQRCAGRTYAHCGAAGCVCTVRPCERQAGRRRVYGRV